MIVWLLAVAGIMAFPVDRGKIFDLLGANVTDVDDASNYTNLIDPSIYIGLRENDWRDAHEKKMIIWSIESHFHPEYGKSYPKGDKYFGRMNKSSQLMSFMILGSVIGFIMYTYLSHVLLMRKLNREAEAARLRDLMKRSAQIMAGSVNQDLRLDFGGRKRSLINMFENFKL